MSTLVAPPDVYAHLPADQRWPDQGDWTYADYLHLPDDGRRYEIIAGCWYMKNAPDLIIEVTSVSTARLDRKVKLDAYERAGVREYWIANPRTRFVEIYALERGEYVLRGEHGPGERLQSGVLPGLMTLTDPLFAK